MRADFLRFASRSYNAGALARLSKRSIVSMFCDYPSSLSLTVWMALNLADSCRYGFIEKVNSLFCVMSAVSDANI